MAADILCTPEHGPLRSTVANWVRMRRDHSPLVTTSVSSGCGVSAVCNIHITPTPPHRSPYSHLAVAAPTNLHTKCGIDQKQHSKRSNLFAPTHLHTHTSPTHPPTHPPTFLYTHPHTYAYTRADVHIPHIYAHRHTVGSIFYFLFSIMVIPAN